MMSEGDAQAPMWSYQVNLDKRVRDDHPLRRINQVLDLGFVRKQVAHTYGQRGNKSVPLEVIIRMMLLLFLDDIKSERELMRIIPERLDYLWFLGYGLDDKVPDHSVLSKARKRWGKEVFVSLFSQVVQQCVEAGLVEGRKIHVDASLVDADANLGSVKPLSAEMLKAIEQTAKEQVQKLDEQDRDQDPPSQDSSSGGSAIGQYSKTNRQFRSTTDPDATLVRHAGLPSRLRYKTHRAVDDAHEIITAVETTTGAVDEASQLLGLIEAHQDFTGQEGQTVIADARYGNVSNLISCQKAGIRAHLKLLGEANKGKGRSAGIYSDEHFSYDPESNTYRCPADQIMKPRRMHPQRLTWEYVTAKGTCLACKLRTLCTRSRTGRTIHRHRDQGVLEKARKIANSKAAKADLKRRQHLMERSFAAVNEALRLRPELPEVHLAMAFHLYSCYRGFERARVQIAIAAQALSNNSALLELTALIDQRQGRWGNATAGLERATIVDPHNPEVLGFLASTYGCLRRYRDSDRIWDRLIERYPNQRMFLVLKVSFACSKTADVKAARAACEALPLSAKNDPVVTSYRVYYAMCARDFAAAEEILNESANEEIDFGGTSVPRQIWALWLKFVRGDHPTIEEFGAAREQLYQKVEADPTNPFLLNALAHADLALGHKEESIEEGQRALEIRPISEDAADGPIIAWNVAEIYALTNQLNVAFAQLDVLVTIPGIVGYGDLKTNPAFDPLRKDPRFDKSLAELAPRD